MSLFLLLQFWSTSCLALELYRAEYQYDSRGMVTNLVETYRNRPVQIRELSYNAHGWLVQEKTAEYDIRYEYDHLGNRVHETHPNEQWLYHYNNRNELWRRDTPDGTLLLSYDLNGSLTQKVAGTVRTLYDWDSRGRLQRASTNDTEIFRAKYAGGLNRLRKTEGSASTVYRHDGFTEIQQVDGSGTVKEWVRGDRGVSSVGGVLYSASEEGTQTYSYNGVGSTVLLSGDDSATKAIHYDAFGNVVASDEGIDAERLANTKEWDRSLGLYFHGARYYDPTIGRYISSDPARDGANHYVYANNAPLSFVDPTGLSSEPKGIAGFYANYFNFQYIWDSNRAIAEWTPPGDLAYSSADIGSAFYEGEMGMGLAMMAMAVVPGKIAEYIPDASRWLGRQFKKKGNHLSISDGSGSTRGGQPPENPTPPEASTEYKLVLDDHPIIEVQPFDPDLHGEAYEVFVSRMKAKSESTGIRDYEAVTSSFDAMWKGPNAENYEFLVAIDDRAELRGVAMLSTGHPLRLSVLGNDVVDSTMNTTRLGVLAAQGGGQDLFEHIVVDNVFRGRTGIYLLAQPRAKKSFYNRLNPSTDDYEGRAMFWDLEAHYDWGARTTPPKRR